RAQLWYAQLQHAYLKGANLQGADLTGACLQEIYLKHANLQEANFRQADLRWAHLEHADFRGADLTGACLQEAYLEHANLQEANLWLADLRWAHLEGTNLSGVNLRNTQIEGIYLYGATLDRTNLTKEQLGDKIGEEWAGEYEKAKDVYLVLKSNFKTLGRYEDAGWAYVKERRMERYASVSEGKLAKWLWLGLFDVLTGHGQKPELVALWSLGFIAAFAAWYAIHDSIHGIRSLIWWKCALEYLIYSAAAFATMTYGDREPKTLCARGLTALEALLGIAMLALLMFVIGNRLGGIGI
ncbi:MAG TPA: hypothetical protein EYP49_18615, partial [Anaerolineae bacterium]|nr:hypothetical protein [Anaerolineae bacterium]